MRNYRLTTIAGIPIQVNISLVVFLPILAWLIGSGVQIAVYADLIEAMTGVSLDRSVLTAGSNPWVIGISAAVGLFVSVAIHELGHAFTARRYGVETESITLWILGGLASFKSLPKEWNREFWIAVAGPLTSLGVGVVCFGALVAMPASAPVATFVAGWLFVTNVVLAAFNMLPAFPMDGGRVLRALLSRSRPYADATRIAARLGTGFAILFAVVGVFYFSPILLLLALFIYGAATGESRIVALETLLEGVTAADLMQREPATVEHDASVDVLVETMLGARRTAYPVIEDGTVVGIVSLADLRAVGDRSHDEVRIAEIMQRGVLTVGPTTPAFDLFTTLGSGDADVAIVEESDGVAGIVTVGDLGEYLQFQKAGAGLRPKAAM